MPVSRRWAAGLATVCLVVSGCASTSIVDGLGARAPLPVTGGACQSDGEQSPQCVFDKSVQNALSDVIAFWEVEYPKIANGAALPPLSGGLYSVDGASVQAGDPLPDDVKKEGCLAQQPKFVVDNGAYCRVDDSIVWDRSPNHLFNQLREKYGDMTVGLIFAHEFGHAVSQRLHVFDKDLPVIDTESQADCAAGAWAAYVLAGKAPHFQNMRPQLDQALEGFLDGRDQTPGQGQSISHGNGFDRLSAIADGIKNGASFCYSPTYFNRSFTERPYARTEDQQSQGNQSLAQVLNPAVPKADGTGGGGGLQPDLNRFWRKAAPRVHKTWKDVQIAEAAHVPCESGDVEFGYCPDTNTVYYNQDFASSAYYSLPAVSVDPSTGDVQVLSNQPADLALGTLFIVGWGLAVRHQLFGDAMDGKQALLSAVCYAGVYAKDVNIASDPSQTRYILLSPPDMDEATSAMLDLVGSSKAFGSRGTSGLDRVQAFVKGYNGTDLSVC